MFADFSPDSDWSNHSHRGWTTLISFALQGVAVGCLLLLPLLYNEGLPRLAIARAVARACPAAGGSANPTSQFARHSAKQHDRRQAVESFTHPACNKHAHRHRGATS